jgi:hypothetical protein
MTRTGIYDQIKSAFQDLIAPELHAIRGDVNALRAETASMRTEMGSMRNELVSEIRRLDARIDSVDRELRTAIDIRERLAALEARRA